MNQTQPPSPPNTTTTSPKAKNKGGPVRWLLVVFGPAAVLALVVWFLLRDHTEHALFLGALAGVMFLVSWSALRHRLRRAGRQAADLVRSAIIALLTVGVLVAVIWYFFLR